MTVISLREGIFTNTKEILDPNVVPSPANGDAPCHVIDGDWTALCAASGSLFLSNLVSSRPRLHTRAYQP
ncbi:Hypothetical protein FKW44_013807 [Caligus rogercresseyi]|uniref:Uncharacterized protein n=1 Tax=Caligus rogercresseyi TaxID=217165 RepID=A0A7T8GY36_CALRO|nr:Hypothetical protein FKW44_013807 [Caligus rogercresseyi]